MKGCSKSFIYFFKIAVGIKKLAANFFEASFLKRNHRYYRVIIPDGNEPVFNVIE